MLVLDFLLDQARRSALREPEPGQPEGRIQVIVTTHSPNLTAWVSPKHLVVVRSCDLPTEGTGEEAPLRKTTVGLSIADLNLKPAEINKISRYLDVTRSALLFGSRALLVEGIAESLLLPVFAERVVLKDDREAFRRFRGAVVVAIDGVDFKPYVEVLLQPLNGARIADRLVVVTDADPAVPGNRKENLEELVTGFGTADNLEVFVNERTLEHELFSAGNEKLLKLAFLAVHSRSRSDWKEQIEAVPSDQRADAFLALLKAKNTRKGDFAQQIAQRVEKGAKIEVPDYLADAIRSIARP